MLPETQSPERPPLRLRLSQHHSASGESSDNSCSTQLCCTLGTFSQQYDEKIDDEKANEKQHILDTIRDHTNNDNRIATNSSDNSKNSIETNLGGITVKDCLLSGSGSTTNSIKIPNAQPQKYNDMNPPQTLLSNPKTEDTYVNYHVTHVQGGGDHADQPSTIAKQSVDGAYSLVANSLKLSTV